AFSWLRLRARLRGRHELAGGPVRRLLDRLLAEAEARAASGAPAPPAAGGVPRRVRLTGSPALPVPVALGVGEREICLPRRALTELGERRQRGLLAHELAHLERRDPAWLLASRAIESLLFLQPLNRLARARLQEISELRCDAWAVAATGDRIGLARCLTEVAGWLARDRAALPVPGMARSRRRLGVRVKRILEGTAEEPPARRRWLPAAAGALLLAGAALVPGLPPSSFAAPQAEAPAAAGPAGAVAGGGPARPPESEGSAASAPPSGPEAAAPAESGPADDEDFENGLGFDHGFDFDFDDFDFDDFDFDFDFDYDFDHDFDLGHDFEPDLAASFDSEEISRLVAEAVAAAQAARVDPAELTAIIQETREAMGEEEWARLQAELARAHAELERANGHLGEELEAELRRADEELERAGEEIQRANRELEEHRRALEWERERREEAPPPRSPRR
ncbi:MAG TPA: M56 family metallopeptidase, partial [Thermoanaerobaculia bacterium]|nr:M56 family metallopeptidase [Thermoanaerobaculia bacterium]